jgi:phosphohistidine phosphatase
MMPRLLTRPREELKPVLTLLLLRHAKSSWNTPGARDFDRPLNNRGKAAAPRIGSYLAQHELVPQLILCSSARRTRDTAELVLSAMGETSETRYDRGIYEGSAETVLHMITTTAGLPNPLMVIGHNPTVQALAIGLAGAGDHAARNALAGKYPTGGLAILDFDIDDWSEIRAQGAYLRGFVRPRELETQE